MKKTIFSVKLVARQFLRYQSNVNSCIGRYKIYIWETFFTEKWKTKNINHIKIENHVDKVYTHSPSFLIGAYALHFNR
jgi:hypothetical protein